jgi:GDP-L-fucose synthase
MAKAACDLFEQGQTGLFNVGSGEELSIRDLARTIGEVTGYDGPVDWDASKPDGTPRKLLDSTRIRATGWRPQITLRDGIRQTYDWYLANAGSETPAAV